MRLRHLRYKQDRSRGHRWDVALYLVDGPLTLEEIRAKYEANPFPELGEAGAALGLTHYGRRLRKRESHLPTDLSRLVDAGLLVLDGERYVLTPEGRANAERATQGALSGVAQTSWRVRSLGEPATAAKLTIGVQVLLAAVKLPAGLLSGSVGLLNDAVDTIVDLFSGLLLYLGVRFKREQLVSTLLVAFMMGAGGLTLYHAVRRLFVPELPEVNWFAFFAAVVSALAGLVLWQYQRFVGRRRGSLAFIALSVDSRNHVFVSLGVVVGLAASLAGVGLVDVLVGIVVALLILWSALDLAIETYRASSGKETDLSRYRFWSRDVFHGARDRLLRTMMMTLVEKGEAGTRAELMERMRRAVDFRASPWMRAAGLARQLAPDALLEDVMEASINDGWLVDGEVLVVSEEGRERLARQARRRSWSVRYPRSSRKDKRTTQEQLRGATMLKTNLDRVAEPDALLIARGILKGYLPHPNLFILRLMLAVPRTKKKIQKNIPEDIKGLLALTIALYSLLLKTEEKEKALSLVKAVVIPIGLAKQYALLRFVEEPSHDLESLVRYSQRMKVEGPMRLNVMDVVDEGDSRYEFRVKNCVFKGVYARFGYPELLGTLCSVDNALYNTYAPDRITFTRGGAARTIARGNATCDFICTASSPDVA